MIQKPSPNFDVGRNGGKPQAIVIHIMDGTLSGTDSWFQSTLSKVSAHYGIGKTGEIHQYVLESDTAWHAGRVDKPTWSLLKPNVNPNLYTIGIEHEGGPNDVWTPEMKNASSSLIKEICGRWNIPIDRDHIIGHYQIFSQKPNCPAGNKGIIDELILMANSNGSTIGDAIKKIQEGLDILKANNK